MDAISPTETGKRGGHIPIETRAQIIHDWKNGLPIRQTARKYEVARNSVKSLIKKYKRTGDVKDLERPGRVRIATTPENWRRMAEILESNPKMTRRELAKQLNLSLGSVSQMHAAFQRSRSITGQLRSSKPVDDLNRKSPIENLEPMSKCAHQAVKFLNHSPRPSPPASVPTAMTSEDNDWNEDDDNHCAAGDNQDQGEVVEAHRCFLCDSLGAQLLDVHFSPDSTPDVPVQVHKSLGVICFLGKVLKMRNEDLVTLMKEAEGRNPSEWGISVCSDPDCAEAVERTMDLWKEIRKLEQELITKGKVIIGRIRKTLNGNGGTMVGEAVLNKRVRQVLMTSQSKEGDEVREYLSEPVIKVEPQVEDLNDFDDDFHVSEDLSNDGDEIHFGVEESGLKVEVDEELASRRRSSRMKRKSERFEFDDPSLSKKRRHGRVGTTEGRKVPLEKEKKKVKSGSNDKSKLAERKDPSAPVKKATNSTKKSDEDIALYSCQMCRTLERMDMDKFIAHICFHSRCRYKCSGCNSYFLDSSACLEHSEKCGTESADGPAKFVVVSPTEAVGKIWNCSRAKCKSKFANGADRVRHEMKVHGIPVPEGANDFSCPLCPNSSPKFYSLTELRLHKAIEHPEEAILSCSYCDTQFAIQSEKDGIRFLNLDQLRKHICEEHPEKMKKVKGPPLPQFLQTCHICGLVFSSFSFTKLDNHMVQEHSMNLYENYSCPICPQNKMRNADVWKHVKKCHWPDAPNPFICQFCGKGFRHNQNWKIHESIHKNKETRPFQCELCGSSFAVKTYLYIHSRVTHQHRPFPSTLRKRTIKQNDRVPLQPT